MESIREGQFALTSLIPQSLNERLNALYKATGLKKKVLVEEFLEAGVRKREKQLKMEEG
jgi:predicted DNA-binding protein